MKLQIDTIKTVFSGLEHHEQIALIRDLMEEAKIDSIVHNKRPVNLAGLHIPAPPTYRDDFLTFLSPFLCSFLIVIEQEYIDQCFDLYEILRHRSIGSRYESQADLNDQFLYAKIEDPNNPDWVTAADDGELFESELAKAQIFTKRIFNQADINLIQLLCFRFGGIPINIKLTDLFVLLLNNYDYAYIVLMLFGYLSNDTQKDQKYKAMLLEIFPNYKTIEEIVINEKIKLSTLFSLKFV